jgi:AcrR family transcriptional regulator
MSRTALKRRTLRHPDSKHAAVDGYSGLEKPYLEARERKAACGLGARTAKPPGGRAAHGFGRRGGSPRVPGNVRITTPFEGSTRHCLVSSTRQCQVVAPRVYAPRSMRAQPGEDELRERVLDASVALIEERGLTAFSMREVARRAGVSHQAPYHHFTDRESILAAICERGFDILANGLARARVGKGSAADRFERAAVAYVEFACNHAAYFRVMFRPELITPSKHPSLEASAARAFAHVPRMIADCVDEGLQPDPSFDALIAAAWSFVHGLASLLVDGPLERKVRATHGSGRAALIREAVRAFRLMITAAIDRGKDKARNGGRPKATRRAHPRGGRRG